MKHRGGKSASERPPVALRAYKSTGFAAGLIRALFAFGLSLAEVKSGVYPFGLAYLCGENAFAFPAFAGVFAAGFVSGENGVYRSLLAMAVFGSKWLFLRKRKTVPVWATGTISAAVTCALILRELTERNALFERVTDAACVFALLPMFALLFAVDLNRCGTVWRDIAVLARVYSAVRALGAAGLLAPAVGTALSLAAGGFITLYYARESPFFGGMCGFAAGLAAGTAYLPVLAIAGLAYGIFWDEARVFALIFSASVSLSAGVYLTSLTGAFPEFAYVFAGFAVFGVISRRFSPPKRRHSADAVRRKERPVTLGKISSAFASLSEAFWIDGAAPDKDAVASSLRSSLFSVCGKCRKCGKCGLDKFDVSNHLAEIAFGTETALPPHIASACPNATQLENRALGAARGGTLGAAEKQARLLTESCGSVARLLREASERAEENDTPRKDVASAVAKTLKSLGVGFDGVSAKGRRITEIRVSGIEPSKINVSSRQLRSSLSDATGILLSLPEFVAREQSFELRMHTVPSLRLEYARAEAAKSGEAVSGDTAVTFESDVMTFYSLLADGMGSGKDASSASRLAALFMEKLIVAGGDKKEALSMLNNILLVRGEVYTTLDLLEIDRISGNASLIKAGAAPTYLCRGGKSYRLEASTPPVGVISALKVTQTNLRVQKGDVFVMMSDGVAPAEGTITLPAMKDSVSSYAYAILESRRAETRNFDDMSVCVIRAY